VGVMGASFPDRDCDDFLEQVSVAEKTCSGGVGLANAVHS